MEDRQGERFFAVKVLVQNSCNPGLFAALFICFGILHAIENPDVSR
jgi:hypothetical protein